MHDSQLQLALNSDVWIVLSVLFVVAGAMNLARGFRRTDARRPVNLALGVSSLLFAAGAALMRFVAPVAGYMAVGLAVLVWLYAALAGARRMHHDA